MLLDTRPFGNSINFVRKNASLHDNGLSHITAHSTYSIMVYWLIALEAGSVHSKIYETTLPDDPR